MGSTHFLLDKLPEDVFDHLYSLLPMRDAARSACVSRGFLCSWRRYPRLLFSDKALGLDGGAIALSDKRKRYRFDKIEGPFVNRIDQILRIRSCSGFRIKALRLHLSPCPNIDAFYIDRWLQIAVKPGIEELALKMNIVAWGPKYNFPFSLLSDDVGATLQSLRLQSCALHPTTPLGCTRSLTHLHLYYVRVTEEELGQFVSNCPALVQLSISRCKDIICFKVPRPMQQLNHLLVTQCYKLQVIEICAPKLFSFVYGENLMQISLGAEVKHISVGSFGASNMIYHAQTMLPSCIPSVERLTVAAGCREVRMAVMPSKFLHLKYLEISLVDLLMNNYDHFRLVSFLDNSPALETFILHAEPFLNTRSFSIPGGHNRGELHLRPECRYDNLKNVTITGFTSAKDQMELAIHIVQNAPALSCMTLDTARSCSCRNTKAGRCLHMAERWLMEAQKAIEAVGRCIAEGILPLSPNLKVLEPCGQCGQRQANRGRRFGG